MLRHITRRTVLAAGGFAASTRLFPAVARAAESEKVNLALDWYPNANHAGLFLAQANGDFEAAGLEISIATPSDPTTVLQTVGAGRDTFGISYQTDVLLARAQGVPVVSIAALVQHPLTCVMALKTSGITRPRDLAGKSVGYPGIPSQEAFLATMLETDGSSMSEIELVNVEFNLVPAVISGNVAAVMGAFWTHETILADREGYPVDVLRVEDWGVPDYYELVLVASEDTVRDRADMVTRFLGAVERGYTAAIGAPMKAIAAIAKAYPETDQAVEAAGMELLISVWTAPGVPFGTQTAARWTALGDWMKQHNLIPADLDVSQAVRLDLLPAPAAATPTAGA